jgi:hypothetical protein
LHPFVYDKHLCAQSHMYPCVYDLCSLLPIWYISVHCDTFDTLGWIWYIGAHCDDCDTLGCIGTIFDFPRSNLWPTVDPIQHYLYYDTIQLRIFLFISDVIGWFRSWNRTGSTPGQRRVKPGLTNDWRYNWLTIERTIDVTID